MSLTGDSLHCDLCQGGDFIFLHLAASLHRRQPRLIIRIIFTYQYNATMINEKVEDHITGFESHRW